MRYHIDKSYEDQTSKPYAVVKNSNGKIMGCHRTLESAQEYIEVIEAEGEEEEVPSHDFAG